MIEGAPGITQLLDRLEAKQLVRRQCVPTIDDRSSATSPKLGSNGVRELDAPMKEKAVETLRRLKNSEIEERIRWLELARKQH
jgi:hypothetical protein